MKRFWATVLLASCCSQSAVRARELVDPTGPLARAAAEAIEQLAAEQTLTPAGWGAVRAAEPSSDVVITTASGTLTRRILSADNSSVTLLNVDLPNLGEQARRSLLELARSNREALAATAIGGAHLLNEFCIGPNGVCWRNQKLGERTEIIERVPIEAVVLIARPHVRRGSPVAAALGAGVAAALALRLTLFADLRGNGFCGVLGTWVGLPLLGGYGAWRATSMERDEIIYRARPAP